MLLAALAWPSSLHAEPLVVDDAALESKAAGIDRQLHGILAVPFGWGLEAYVDDPADRTLVDDFIASGSDDFEAATGTHPYDVVTRYEEVGDLGMFGGVQVAGDAFRYAVLRDGGAPAAEVDRARTQLVAAMRGLHWYTQVTGVPGVMARGIRRITPEAGEPPLPEEPPMTVPLFDASGNPQPAVKEPTWRDDASGQLPFLVWLDDTSKDQVDGYIFALGAVYDVVADDSTIPADAVAALVEDARAIGNKLMEKIDVGSGTIDLVLVDADGRPTSFHDLNAEEASPGVLLGETFNGFNAWMALSIVRTLHHMSGDEALGKFYRELVHTRGYPESFQCTADPCVVLPLSSIYFGTATNFSNVNMAFVAAYGLLRYENDPELAQIYRTVLEAELYAPGVDREARGLGQSFFDFMYAGFRVGGSFGPGEDALGQGIATLGEAPAAPYWDTEVVNCDAAEIASLDCVASDGTPLPLSDEEGWKGGVVAIDPVPMRLRPPTNFEWRSDPHSVNGGGSTRLNPGAGFYTAYWMGRFLQRTTDGLDNISPRARELPREAPPSDELEEEASGCACGVAPSRLRAGWLLLLLSGLLCARRRAPW